MARTDDVIKGVAIGIGAAVLIPVVITALVPVVRPLARSVFKAGLLAYEKGRETVEEFGEVVEDMVAEVEDEMFDSRNPVDHEDGFPVEDIDNS